LDVVNEMLMVDFWYVTTGAVIAHGCCTGLAVIGGRLLASKISARNGIILVKWCILTIVTLGGAVLFLAFGVIYLYEAFVLEV
jgi:Ca2+/H+ antiporter, TMEM165/GDT1 family